MFKNSDEIEMAILEFAKNEKLIDLEIWADYFASFSRSGISFELSSANNEGPLATCRLGGWPDLPDDISWPWRQPNFDAEQRRKRAYAEAEIYRTGSREDKFYPKYLRDNGGRNPIYENALWSRDRAIQSVPLAFIAQYNLEEIAQSSPLQSCYPKSGMLNIFLDTEQGVH